MSMYHYINFILLIFFIGRTNVSSIEVKDIYDINSMYKYIDGIHNNVLSNDLFENSILSHDQKYDIFKKLFGNMSNALEDLNTITNDSDDYYWPIDFPSFLKKFDKDKLKRNSVLTAFLSSASDKIEERIKTIDVHVASLLEIAGKKFYDNVHDYSFFVTQLLLFINSNKRSPYDNIEEEYMRLTHKILVHIEAYGSFCQTTSSLHHGIYDYYRRVIATFLKRFTMVYHLETMDAIANDVNPTELTAEYVEEAKNTLKRTMSKTLPVLKYMKHYLYRCDPKEFLDKDGNKNYYELEKMVQTVIVTEEELSTTGSSSHNCNLKEIKGTINSTECREYRDCQYIEGSYEISKADEGNSRRYEWFVDEKAVLHGGNCTKECDRNSTSAYSKLSFSIIRWCDYRICTCVNHLEDKKNVVTAFSFREQVTKISDNLVVVGVRFIKKDHMIQVQIKEGKLKPRRFKDHGVWKESEKIVYDEENKMFMVTNNDGIMSQMQLGNDYALPETINFDDLIAPEGFVVTGVRFRFAGDSLDFPKLTTGAIELQVRVTPFDYVSGTLINHNQTHWIAPKYNDTREELILTDPDVPTKSPTNTITSKTNQFIRFRASDLKKDAGQSTVPFFDAQDVDRFSDFPLGGVGIIHRGREGYGGFLAFRIYDLNLSNLLIDNHNS
ncbi:uncharacterized protein LOC130672448 [Microplitis mediator]|uniref:uncharacterized protein LOC130672448 n=1 Tax=Microplitis mediator TaxID=375433 RepID=UPI00255764AF|nr:uncharacterized protein LOC130672448 [Microplitis mediator]